MDRVTRATPFLGMVGRPVKANTWYSLQHTHFDDARFNHSKAIQGVWNSRMRYVALTTPNWGTLCRLKVSTSRGQTVHKIWSL